MTTPTMIETCHFCSQHHELERLRPRDLVGDSLTDKRVLITGVSGGIGREIAALMVGCGAKVGGVRRTGEAIDGIFNISADLRHISHAAEAFAQFIDFAGGIDVLVNCAGHGGSGKLYWEVHDDEWRDAFGLHTIAAFELSARAGGWMKAQRWGRIINISTTAVARPSPNGLPYACSKAAMEVLTNRFAVDGASHNVLVNTVRCGPLDTLMGGSRKTPERAAMVPLGRLGTAEEVARAVVFLASRCGDWITGSTLTISGGE